MLQQTRVETVVPYFERFLEKFPTVGSLAAADEHDVLLAWAGLGYYSRARNLRRAAKQVGQAGGFPDTRDGWLDLPGVGEYTAGAVLSIALNKPEAILDANVKRVLSRFFRPFAGNGKFDKEILWKLSGEWVRSAWSAGIEPRVTNQALMELGALVCQARSPECGNCPLSSGCRSLKMGDASYVPVRVKKKWIGVEESVCAVVVGGKGVLLTDRDTKWRKGLWDLPGKLPAGLDRKTVRAGGKFSFNYAVTRHRVKRTVRVFHAKSVRVPGGFALFPLRELERPKLALGSSARKSLVKLSGLVHGNG